MWIQVRTMDGKKSFQVDGLSKLTKIEELREKMENELEVIPNRQRLFFAGKQVCVDANYLIDLKTLMSKFKYFIYLNFDAKLFTYIS